MNERDGVNTPPILCEFYAEGECQYLNRYPDASLPSLARVRRPHTEELMSIVKGSFPMAGKRNYVCQARFSLDPGGFQKEICSEYACNTKSQLI